MQVCCKNTDVQKEVKVITLKTAHHFIQSRVGDHTNRQFISYMYIHNKHVKDLSLQFFTLST